MFHFATLFTRILTSIWVNVTNFRFAAACQMAEAGATDEEIGDITGQTLQRVQHYTKSVRQIANATRAIQARERWLEAHT